MPFQARFKSSSDTSTSVFPPVRAARSKTNRLAPLIRPSTYRFTNARRVDALGVDAGEVDDRAGPLLLHDRRGVLDAIDHAIDVHRRGLVQTCGIEVFHTSCHATDAGIVHQAVEPSKTFEHGADAPLTSASRLTSV